MVLQAIFVNPKTGEIEANADFRKQGEVDGFWKSSFQPRHFVQNKVEHTEGVLL